MKNTTPTETAAARQKSRINALAEALMPEGSRDWPIDIRAEWQIATQHARKMLTLPPRGQSVSSPKLAALQGREPQAPIALRSGRVVIHKFDRDNTQHAIPVPGSPEMTESEWEDYCSQLTSAMRKEGARRIS